MQNQIPNNWQKVKLGEIAENFDSKRIPLSSVERLKRKGNIPYYGASGIIDYVDNYLLDGEYLLVSEDGENLKSRNTPIAFLTKGKFWVNNHAHIIKSKNDFDNKLIRYWFSQNSILPFITGSAQPKLNQENLNAIELLWPEESIRKNIAKVLSSFDDKIELNNKIAKTLENMASTIFKEWFVKTGIGFRIGNIGDLMRVKHGFAFPSNKFKPKGEVPVIKIKNILEDRSIDTNNVDYINKNDFRDLTNFKINNGDILIALTGATSGKIGILMGNHDEYLLNQRVGKFSFKKNSYKWFCYIFLTQSSYRNLLLNSSNGSAQGNLNPDQIESIEINIPDNELLEKFNNIVSSFYKKIIKSKLENQKLLTMRDLLLPKLMKGEIRI